MAVFRGEIYISSKGYCDIHNVTDEVEKILGHSKIQDGLCNVFVSGSTIAIATIEYEPGLLKDLTEFFDGIFPEDKIYHHNETWHDGNGFSHMRSALIGPDCTIPVHQGKLQLGTWQQIIILDFDNKSRKRLINVTILG